MSEERVRTDCVKQFSDISNNLSTIASDLVHIKKIYLGNGSPPLSVRLDRIENEMDIIKKRRLRILDSKSAIIVALVSQAIWAAVTIVGVAAAIIMTD